MFEIQYTLSAFTCLSRRPIYRCIFCHVKELGSLHNPEKNTVQNTFYFGRCKWQKKKKNHVTTSIHKLMIFLRHMTIETVI